MAEYLQERCPDCTQPNTTFKVCQISRQGRRGDSCRFVKNYKDFEGNKYTVMRGNFPGLYTVLEQAKDKHGLDGWEPMFSVPWLQFTTFDAAQAWLNNFAMQAWYEEWLPSQEAQE